MIITKFIQLCAITVLLFVLTGHTAKSETNKLQFIKALPIEAPANLNPSGLTYCNGEILLVSDKIDDRIYKMDITGDNAVLETAMTLGSISKHSSEEHAWKTRIIIFLKSLLSNSLYDWEGIACDFEGNLLLLSETYVDVAIVSKLGEISWLNTDLLKAGKQQGLFQVDNAYVEGIASPNGQNFFVAAERQPRGLAKISKSDETWKTEFYSTETSPIPPKEGRSSDFSGLAVYNNMLYSLERNASAVCARHIDNLKPTQCWSYAHIEESTDFRYQDNTYGLGEGIIFTNEYLLVVLDNNGDSRLTNPADRRAQVFIFQKPVITKD